MSVDDVHLRCTSCTLITNFADPALRTRMGTNGKRMGKAQLDQLRHILKSKVKTDLRKAVL
jgi:hypothetical protein